MSISLTIFYLSILTVVHCALRIDQLNFYVLGDKGESCTDACSTRQAFCDVSQSFNRDDKNIFFAFQRLNVRCVMDDRPWYDFTEPCVVVDPFDDNFGRCLGWRNGPKSSRLSTADKNPTENGKSSCAGRWPTVRRLCQCTKKFDVNTAKS
uniref:Uncharacterized protein n=1 Tax=Romanomermis culicivorax TaxID=13658 RepID=A0A915J9N8_ROMCU